MDFPRYFNCFLDGEARIKLRFDDIHRRLKMEFLAACIFKIQQSPLIAITVNFYDHGRIFRGSIRYRLFFLHFASSMFSISKFYFWFLPRFSWELALYRRVWGADFRLFCLLSSYDDPKEKTSKMLIISHQKLINYSIPFTQGWIERFLYVDWYKSNTFSRFCFILLKRCCKHCYKCICEFCKCFLSQRRNHGNFIHICDWF